MLIQKNEQQTNYSNIQKYYDDNKNKLVNELYKLANDEFGKYPADAIFWDDDSVDSIGVAFNYKSGEIHFFNNVYEGDDSYGETSNWGDVFSGLNPGIQLDPRDITENWAAKTIEDILPQQIQNLYQEDWNYLSDKGYSKGVVPPLEFEEGERLSERIGYKLNIIDLDDQDFKQEADYFSQIFANPNIVSRISLNENILFGLRSPETHYVQFLYDIFSPAINSDEPGVRQPAIRTLSEIINIRRLKTMLNKISRSPKNKYSTTKQLLKLLLSDPEVWDYYAIRFSSPKSTLFKTKSGYYRALAKINPEFSSYVKTI